MTFSELMRATNHMQTVMLVLGEDESITGNAEAMDGYLTNLTTGNGAAYRRVNNENT